MNVITGGRLSGKTTELIKLAANRKGYIICRSAQMTHTIMAMAADMRVDINMPITHEDFIARRFVSIGCAEFYIDDADALLRLMARGATVLAVTIDMSGPGVSQHMAGRE